MTQAEHRRVEAIAASEKNRLAIAAELAPGGPLAPELPWRWTPRTACCLGAGASAECALVAIAEAKRVGT
jgi:hypothetical protein